MIIPKTLGNGERFKATYKAPIFLSTDRSLKSLTYDNLGIVFNYKFPDTKGVEPGAGVASLIVSNGTRNSEDIRLKIQTSSDIPFQPYGKIYLKMNGIEKEFTIVSVVGVLKSAKVIGAEKDGNIDLTRLDKILDLR